MYHRNRVTNSAQINYGRHSLAIVGTLLVAVVSASRKTFFQNFYNRVAGKLNKPQRTRLKMRVLYCHNLMTRQGFWIANLTY